MRTLVDESANAQDWASSVPPPASAAVGGVAVQRSPWHSPVPYLFGGLAAMLGLIAFALLILACSYWKMSGSHEGEGGDDIEKGAAEKGKDVVRVYEEKIVVIMAGDEKPTYLATPVCSRGSSFGEGNKKTEDRDGKKESADGLDKVGQDEKNQHDGGDHVNVPTLGSSASQVDDQ